MKQLKVCDVCGLEIGKYQCRKCKGLICESDYDQNTGICENCKFNL